MESRKHAKKAGVVVRFVKDWPAQEIIKLYESAGWWDGSKPSSVRKIILGSFVYAVAVDEETGKAVGMGRAMSDGVSDAYIQDIVVLPEYRRREVGKKLIVALRDYCLAKKVAWIALIAEPGTEQFYRGLGFQEMEGNTPMRYAGTKKTGTSGSGMKP